ncbi:PQQ-binding-like beta-propeller repeat protein [Cellulomonas sp. H30R-01]|uniref:outer membrane protein assembly factor BamB family protein n=1 Tax=Cellulomonas sp. H30R-01 TaxID=2704467 RepID=UPI00138B203E|nr:PQQ-binding-like beta-propeller repeat protein [Cellulomonas sp. H30R-01]QHT56129.1 PQQ-binding-like beta-propeller repeat protein [Cellulomonas sp. H30R-01]
MGAAGPGPALQRVPLDEVDEADAGTHARPPSGFQRAARLGSAWAGWRARSPWRAVAVLVGSLGLAVTLAVTTPSLVTAHERSTVLRPGAFAGAIRTSAAPAVRWTVTVDDRVPPLLVGDTVVVATGPGPDDRSLAGLDVVTGAVRWQRPLGADPRPAEVRCLEVQGSVACTLGPDQVDERVATRSGLAPTRDAAALVLLDPATGEVLRRATTPGRVVSLATDDELDGDVVLAAIADGVLTIRRTDPATGEVRWVATRPSAFPAASTSRVRVSVGGGLVVATAEGSTLVVHLDDGVPVPPPADATGTDETALLSDGTLVRTRYRVHAVGVDVVSELSHGDGEPWLTTRGVPVEPTVTDGSSELVFTSSVLAGGPMGGRVRAYAPGRTDPEWHALTPAREIAVDAGGRVVLRAAGALVGLDVESGRTVWRRTFGLGMGPVFSDGRLVVVQRTSPGDGSALVALDLRSGAPEWVAPLPPGARTVVQLGAHLYVVSDDALTALR